MTKNEIGILLSTDRDNPIHVNGENINMAAVSDILSAWKSLSGTKAPRSKAFVVGTLLLEELASRIAEKDINIVTLSQNIDEKNSLIIGLDDRVKGQQDMLDNLRGQCQKFSIKQHAQNIKIKLLEKDKKCLHDLIDYQKEAIK